jgi:hypothetical protein
MSSPMIRTVARVAVWLMALLALVAVFTGDRWAWIVAAVAVAVAADVRDLVRWRPSPQAPDGVE